MHLRVNDLWAGRVPPMQAATPVDDEKAMAVPIHLTGSEYVGYLSNGRMILFIFYDFCKF